MKRTRRFLEQQADIIEAVLAEHKTAARVTGGFVQPECIRFVLAPEAGVTPDQVIDLAAALACALQQPETRVYYADRMLQVEIPRPEDGDFEPAPGARAIPAELAALLGAAASGGESVDLAHTLLDAVIKHRH